MCVSCASNGFARIRLFYDWFAAAASGLVEDAAGLARNSPINVAIPA